MHDTTNSWTWWVPSIDWFLPFRGKPPCPFFFKTEVVKHLRGQKISGHKLVGRKRAIDLVAIWVHLQAEKGAI
jgi:hypothetical protein